MVSTVAAYAVSTRSLKPAVLMAYSKFQYGKDFVVMTVMWTWNMYSILFHFVVSLQCTRDALR